MPGTPQGRSAPDQVMAAALGQTARSGGPDCLDADELAAYYERSLGARELARAETHVASCRACQERLVALVRSEPAPAPAPAWWRAWVGSPRRWVWAAPALAAALVAAIWLATRPASAPVPDFTVASNLKAPERASEEDAARQKESEETSTVAAPITAEKPQPQQPAEPLPVGGGRAEPKRETPKREAAAEAPPAGIVAGKVELADERMAKADKRVAKEAAAATERRADIAANQAFASAARATLPVLLPAPGSRIVWRIDAAGAIARSDNGGTTWRSQATAGVGLTAGSAVSETVCWVVGRDGAVLRTDDGERWERVTAPAAVDLVEIEATDALHGRVTASDGRRFETADGGKTWVEKGAWHLFPS